MTSAVCRYCGETIVGDWPVIAFRGDARQWCGTLADAPVDATELGHPFCLTEQEGADALVELMPRAEEPTDCGHGQLSDGSRWRLLMQELHTEVSGDKDIQFTLFYEPGATGYGGGPLWSVRSHELPSPISVMAQQGHGAVHVVPGKISKEVRRVVAHLDNDETAPATIITMPSLPFDVFVASAPWPRWIISIDAEDRNGVAIGSTPPFKPSAAFERARQRSIDREQ